MSLRFQPVARIGMTAIEIAEQQNLRYTIWLQDRVTFNFLRTYGLSIDAIDNLYYIPRMWKRIAPDGGVAWVGAYEKCVELADAVADQRALNVEQNKFIETIVEIHNRLEE